MNNRCWGQSLKHLYRLHSRLYKTFCCLLLKTAPTRQHNGIEAPLTKLDHTVQTNDVVPLVALCYHTHSYSAFRMLLQPSQPSTAYSCWLLSAKLWILKGSKGGKQSFHHHLNHFKSTIIQFGTVNDSFSTVLVRFVCLCPVFLRLILLSYEANKHFQPYLCCS